MALFTRVERVFVLQLSRLMYSNPFLPERIAAEKELLGDAYAPAPWVYHKVDEFDHEHPNLTRLDERVEQLAGQVRQRLTEREHRDRDDLELYADLASYLLYRRFRSDMENAVRRGLVQPSEPSRAPFWKRFVADYDHFLELPGLEFLARRDPAYLLACFFQIRRAFFQIYHLIAGASRPATLLRAAVWQSIFTHDMERYFRLGLYDRMGRFPTLIIGPSGTGKELVARAIGLSRFIPFDRNQGRFAAGFAGSFHALNVSALAPSLVESELFGHAKGAFTGADRERPGWLEDCGETGSIFLDEIGELDPAIQVKLLRVVQERRFCRLGDTRERRFDGKLIAATNRDLAAEMRAGRFREDLYYRLCGDVIVTPGLAEQLRDCPADLPDLLRLIVKRVTDDEVEELAAEVEHWIRSHAELGADYAWPGNFRELEQCAWNVLIRKEYHPPRRAAEADPVNELIESLRSGDLTADELEGRYATLLYAKTQSYQETARRLGRNWRTVKCKIDTDWLRQLDGGKR